MFQPSRISVECVEIAGDIGTDVAKHRPGLGQAFA
jgi:hypothetical protein